MSYLIYIACFILGWKFREYTAVRKMTKLLNSKKSEDEDDEEEEEVNKVPVRIERNGDMFYLYNLETQEFLAQGKSKDEIQELLKLRFGNKFTVSFHATPDNIKEVGFE